MKIAVAVENNIVSEHFGHCENFCFFNIENNKIISREKVANPGHKPGFLPLFLKEKGINIIIAGGMGGGAVQLFIDNDIEVITGVVGDVEEVINKFLKKELVYTNKICDSHNH